MKAPKIAAFFKSVLFKLTLIVIASLLYALAFPNPLLPEGFWPAAFAAYLPVFYVVRRVNRRESAVFGALYGALTTALFSYWLAAFHPLALPLAALVKAVYYALFFTALRGVCRFCPRADYAAQTFLWVIFEYAQSLGYLGYTYGFAGYSQWNNNLLLQTAAVTGVWGVSALVLFPQAWLAFMLEKKTPAPAAASAPAPASAPAALSAPAGRLITGRPPPTGGRPPSTGGRPFWGALPPLIYLLILGFCLVWGGASRVDTDLLPRKRIALVQQNDNPWKSAVADYRVTLETLVRLSNEALAEEKTPPALVVWPETAFVPMVYWHIRYRTDAAYYELVKELTDYLAARGVPFLIGNDDGRRDERSPGLERVDYNAALLFERGEIAGVYRKQRLVPFAEHFPYKKILPGVHALLKKAGFSFWEAGSEAVVFKPDDWRFAVLICFEDGFGSLARERTRRGAQALVNMTNDSWGRSLPCQMQHLAMSVFRAVENRRAVVRAATSGQTCAIDPNGRVTAMAKPFTAASLNVDAPLASAETFYTRYGDYFPFACAILLAAFLASGLWALTNGRQFRYTLKRLDGEAV